MSEWLKQFQVRFFNEKGEPCSEMTISQEGKFVFDGSPTDQQISDLLTMVECEFRERVNR